MRYLLTALFCATIDVATAQSASAIIQKLDSISRSIATLPCNAASTTAISHRAMNIFLADKTGYAGGSRDLSFFTNYVTVNSAEGKFTVNHNFQPAPGIDDPLRKLLSIGFDMTVANSYAKSFLDKRFENELGITLNYKWLGKVKTRFADCTQTEASSQKKAMDALRSGMAAQLKMDILQQETDFNKSLNEIDSLSASQKTIVRNNFYANLKNLYEEKFAAGQAEILSKTLNFSCISTHWTSLTAYIPLYFPTYATAPSLNTAFSNRHPYPLRVYLGHTRLWESASKGRLLFTIEGSLLLNNAKLSYRLNKMTVNEYQSLGGSALAPGADPSNGHLYIGSYTTFITPSVDSRLLYFPSNSHIGLSVLAEQSFGTYHLLNCKLGVPIVLINSKKIPAVNIECYVLLFDLTKQSVAIGGSTAGLSIGVPFSRLMY